MKIIFITREGYNLSGARVRCYNFSRQLAKYNVETEVFSFAEKLGAKYGENEFKMGFLKKLKYNAQAWKYLRKNIDKNTLIFMQRLNYHSLAPFLITLFKRNKFIFDCDDWNIRENPKYYLGFYPSSKMEYLTRKISGYSHICIAASRFLENYLKKFNAHVYYLPTGVDTDIFNPDKYTLSDNSKIVFSWIGTLYHPQMRDNLKFILSCFAIVAARFDHVFLALAAEGKYYQVIQNEAKSLSCSQRIILHPWISPDNIPEHLSKIDIGLLPLIQDSNFNQAKSPTKLFEYMSMAKPTISSNIGEAKNIIRHGETGFLARNQDEFVSCMLNLAQEPHLRHEIGNNARREITENYSLAVLGKKLYGILSCL
jgi:glycosyltransferase involved in cell wall biosynthesis